LTDFHSYTGGTAPGAKRFAKSGVLWRITHRGGAAIQAQRRDIIEAPLLAVRVARTAAMGFAGRSGRSIGKIEESFIEALSPGDTFLFAGLILRYEGIRENEVIATRTADDTPKIPIYAGGKFPITSFLADGVRSMLADPKTWKRLPPQVSDWLKVQKKRSLLPKRDQLLVESFPRGGRTYMVAYPFEGRLAHQTLGMLLTRRLERAGFGRPFRGVGLCDCIWALAIWPGVLRTSQLGDLFEDMLGDDLEAWMADSYLLKRMFRNTALISGLIEKRHPGREKSGRQVTVSTDLVYDVLRRHEPDHILLQATWADAATGLLEVARVGEMLSRVKGRIVHKRLDRISPLAVPAMLQIGRERVGGESGEDVLPSRRPGTGSDGRRCGRVRR
jgi:ATP-dependent Lhr-like helicase